MILSCSNICKSFGENDILKQVSFHIEDHEKAAIVGINGGALEQFEKMGMEQIHVSISNTNGLAMAFAVGEGRGEQKK